MTGSVEGCWIAVLRAVGHHSFLFEFGSGEFLDEVAFGCGAGLAAIGSRMLEFVGMVVACRAHNYQEERQLG